MTSDLRDRIVLLAGGTSTAGRAAARALLGAGARVVVVGHDPGKLAALATELPGITGIPSDLTDEISTHALAAQVHDEVGRVDGVLHLVGGWRGGGGLAGQSEKDYRFLERSFTALRNVTRSFDADLRASDVGRFAMVSSTAVTRPLAGGANYAAVKAASEAWTRAVAQGFTKSARDTDAPLRAASVIFRVKALDGLETALADAYIGLFDADAASINDTVITLPGA